MEEQETVPCRLCGNPTTFLSTKVCDPCWELETRIHIDPIIARKILAAVDAKEAEEDKCEFYPGPNNGCVCAAGSDVSGPFFCTKEYSNECSWAKEQRGERRYSDPLTNNPNAPPHPGS